MLDQAEALRTLFKDRLMCCGPMARTPRLYTVAVTSGKGGVGKTSIAVNLALLLCRNGRQVRLIDADFGLSNAEVLLGVTPKYGLADIASGRLPAVRYHSPIWVNSDSGVGEGIVIAGFDVVYESGRVPNHPAEVAHEVAAEVK